MESLSPLALSVAAASMFVGAVALSAAGFGMGLVALPFMLLVLDPVTAIVAVNIAQTPLYLFVLRDTSRRVRVRDARTLALPGTAGAVLGTFVLAATADEVLRIAAPSLIAALAIIVATVQPERIRPPTALGPILGFAASVMQGTLGIGGPLVALYALARGWTRDSVRGTLAAYFLAVMVVLCAGYAAAALLTPSRLVLIGIMVVPVLVGAVVGSLLARAMSEAIFRRVAVGLVLFSSAGVLIRELVA